MIWLAYAGMCIVGIGCFVLMIALMEYEDVRKDLAEELAGLDRCGNLLPAECKEASDKGIAYASERVADNYRTITIGFITIGSGIALFVIAFVRPSWFSRISVEASK